MSTPTPGAEAALAKTATPWSDWSDANSKAIEAAEGASKLRTINDGTTNEELLRVLIDRTQAEPPNGIGSGNS